MLQKAEETQVVKYSVVEADIANMKSVYMGLTITDLEDDEQFKQVKEARLIVKGKRCAVEKERKSLKKEALAWGKKVDTRAKEIFTLIEPIESHLQTEEQKVLDEQERIKAEEAAKEKAMLENRFNDLFAVGYTPTPMELGVMTYDEFQCFLDDKTFEFNEAQKAKAEAEAAEKKRLADEEIARKAESDRLAKQKAEQDAKEAALKKQADDIAAQQKAIDDEYARIAKKEADKQMAEDARIRDEADAKAKAEQDAKDAAEKQIAADNEAKRQAALLPEKETLRVWLTHFGIITNHPLPTFETKEAKVVLREICDDFEIFLQDSFEKIEEL